ncbi:MAG: VC2046/SO_2500 family protein [Colwellia sp.]
MAIESLKKQSLHSEPLLHELQLGEQLNKSVHQARRADFSLMLAMLTEDVREQSQFALPVNDQFSSTEVSDTRLRKLFNLPAKVPLSLKNMAQINLYNQGQSIAGNDVLAVKLNDVLVPRPLAFRNNPKHIDTDILNNTTLVCQLKHKQQKSAEMTKSVINKSLTFNAQGWLDAIQGSLVKSTLVV